MGWLAISNWEDDGLMEFDNYGCCKWVILCEFCVVSMLVFYFDWVVSKMDVLRWL